MDSSDSPQARRGAAGLHDVLGLFRDVSANADAARAIVRTRGIDAMLICAAHPPQPLMSKDGEGVEGHLGAPTLFRRLTEGHPPAWLVAQPWPDGLKSGYLLYRIDRSRLAAD